MHHPILILHKKIYLFEAKSLRIYPRNDILKKKKEKSNTNNIIAVRE